MSENTPEGRTDNEPTSLDESPQRAQRAESDNPVGLGSDGAVTVGYQPASPAPALPPTGWYPDPASGSHQRYWDGAAWTHTTRAAQGNDPWGQNPAQVFVAPQTGADPYQGQPYQQQGVYGQQINAPYFPVTSATTEDGVPLAGWWWRVLAALIDGVLLNVLGSVLTMPLAGSYTAGIDQWVNDYLNAIEAGGSVPLPWEAQYDLMGPLILVTVANMVIAVVYSVVLLYLKGGTIGMLATGLRVVPTGLGRQHTSLPVVTAVIRTVLYQVFSFLLPIGLINVLLPLMNAKRQTLHDIIARTQVVKIN